MISPLAGLIIAYALLITGSGLLSTLISLRMAHDAAPAVLIGMVQAPYYLGFIFGAISAGWIIARTGHQRAFCVFAALLVSATLVYATNTTPLAWAGLRGANGFCMACIFTIVESGLNSTVSNGARGRAMALYLTVTYLGSGIGQFLPVLGDINGFALFSLVSGLYAVSLVPIALACDFDTGPPVAISGWLGRLMHIGRTAPLGFWGCCAAGLQSSIFYMLYPVFMRNVGFSVVSISHFMGMALLAALLFQWPIAHFSDRYDRRRVLLGVSLASGACCLMLLMMAATMPQAQPLSYIYAGLLFTIYGLSISLVNDAVPANDRVGVSAALLLVFAVGGSVGPLAASMTMYWLGPKGLYVTTLVVSGLLAVLTLQSLIHSPGRLRATS